MIPGDNPRGTSPIPEPVPGPIRADDRQEDGHRDARPPLPVPDPSAASRMAVPGDSSRGNALARHLAEADPAALRMVSRLACVLTEDHSGILGPDLTEALKDLRKDIENHVGEQSRPQDSPSGVYRLSGGLSWEEPRVMRNDENGRDMSGNEPHDDEPDEPRDNTLLPTSPPQAMRRARP